MTCYHCYHQDRHVDMLVQRNKNINNATLRFSVTMDSKTNINTPPLDYIILIENMFNCKLQMTPAFSVVFLLGYGKTKKLIMPCPIRSTLGAGLICSLCCIKWSGSLSTQWPWTPGVWIDSHWISPVWAKGSRAVHNKNDNCNYK